MNDPNDLNPSPAEPLPPGRQAGGPAGGPRPGSVSFLSVISARLRFVAVFVVAALVVGYWDSIKNHVDKWTRPAFAPDALAAAASGSIEFYCPMHPDVVREEAGQCPKCGMPLVKRKKGEAQVLPADVLARVTLTPRRKALANVGTTAVEYRPLTRDVRSVGVLDFNETKLARLSARVAGRADELFIQYTGQAVKEGDPVYSLYSPEVYTAQREYLQARKRVNDLPKDAPEDAKMDAGTLYNAATQKLVLWGIRTGQLDALDQEFDRAGKIPTNLTVTSPIAGIVVRKEIDPGQYLQIGEAPYTVADLGRLWLQLKLYERDIPLVQIGDAVEVVVEAYPNATFRGAVTFKSFQLDPETRTLDARVEVDNADLRLRPGMYANATVHVPLAPSPATSAPATGPAAPPAVPPAQVSRAYQEALGPYLRAQTLLSEDKAGGVPALLRQAVGHLEPVRQAAAVKDGYARLDEAVRAASDPSLAGLRKSFQEVSAAMIDLGKAAGIPADAPAVKVFRCPMKKANWLQAGGGTANPYYGSAMYDCGSAVETLPRADPELPATRPAPSHPGDHAGKVLAVPRSAVIDTGDEKIVYVESSPGVYDLHAVKLGPLCGDDYPVVEGLGEGDRVVTVGTFLIDAENRLNPQKN